MSRLFQKTGDERDIPHNMAAAMTAVLVEARRGCRTQKRWEWVGDGRSCWRRPGGGYSAELWVGAKVGRGQHSCLVLLLRLNWAPLCSPLRLRIPWANSQIQVGKRGSCMIPKALRSQFRALMPPKDPPSLANQKLHFG